MISEGEPSQPQENHQEQFQFSFTLASFQQTIKQNFQLVEKLLKQHQISIDELKHQIQDKKRPQKATQVKDSSKEQLKKEKSKKETVRGQPSENKTSKNKKSKDESEVKVTQEVQTFPQKPNTAEQILQIDPEVIPSEPDIQIPTESDKDSEVKSSQNDIYATEEPSDRKNNKNLEFSIAQKQAYESKIFELFERVRQLQQKDLVGSRQIQKNFKQCQFSIQATNKALQKTVKDKQEFKEEVEKLRNQLSEYKIKKEAKLNKVLQSSSLRQSSIGGGLSGDNYDYIAEKMQFLLKHVKELLGKKVFEEERQFLQESIDALRRKLGQTINEKFFQQSLKNSEIKIYNTVVKYIKAVQSKRPKGEPDNQSDTQLDKIISEGNRQFNQKVAIHEEQLKQILEKVQGLRSEIDYHRKEKLQREEEVNEQMRNIEENLRLTSGKNQGLDRNMQNMRQEFNKKQLENQSQIIELQEQVQKLNSHVKTYTYSFGEKGISPNKYKEPAEESPSVPLEVSHQLSPERSPSNDPKVPHNFLQQEISLIKKKVNKINVKIQGVKQDLLGVRNDFNRELDGVKMNVEKKSDWDSLKKALTYFEEKQKETKVIVEHLYNSEFSHETGGDDSLAVKKKWTCLMCDRDIKNYQGKLSQAKFTSMFPIRESPRIGGYYKQQQSSQEYKQLFMNNPVGNNRNKRVGSLRSNATNQSREELHG